MRKQNKIILILCVLLLVVSCCNVKQKTEQTDTRSHSETNVTAKHDSVYLTKYTDRFLYISGDTIINREWHFDTIYRWQDRHDTIIIYDSIYRYNNMLVEKDLTKSQIFWIMIGKWSSAIIGLAVIVFVVIKYIKR